jgi:hypothetical protein
MRHAIAGLVLALVIPTLAHAEPSGLPLQFRFCWSAPGCEDADGHPLARAVAYEVWLKSDVAPDSLLATVADDTIYTLIPQEETVCQVRVVAVDSLGRRSEPSEWSDPVVIQSTVDVPDAPLADLAPPFPNPCNPRTTLRYAVPDDLPGGAPVRLMLFDARGQRVRTFATETSPGWHEIQWGGRDDHGRPVSSGTYLAQYVCGNAQQVRRVTLVQ